MNSPAIKKLIKFDALILLGLVLLSFVLFWDSRLDLWAAKLYFHPENIQDSWVEQHNPLWTFFYHAAPWLTGVLLLGSLFFLLLSQFNTDFKKYRIYAVYIFLSIALGSGLVVNSIFKPYWGRPRPREVTELGGKFQYRPFYIPEFGAQGKSFPCGHCSVGFTYGVFYWIFRRRNKTIAALSIAGATVFGALMGIGRIAAGGHFLSDVVWAAIFSWGVCFTLYYFILKIPQREDGVLSQNEKINWLGETITSRKPIAYTLYTILTILTVTALLLASPFYQEIDLKSSTTFSKIQSLNVQIDHGNIDLVLQNDLQIPYEISGIAKGFGFPKNKIISACSELQTAVINCELHKKGFFSDYENQITIKLNPTLIENFELNLLMGEIDISKAGNLPLSYKIHRGVLK